MGVGKGIVATGMGVGKGIVAVGQKGGGIGKGIVATGVKGISNAKNLPGNVANLPGSIKNATGHITGNIKNATGSIMTATGNVAGGMKNLRSATTKNLLLKSETEEEAKLGLADMCLPFDELQQAFKTVSWFQVRKHLALSWVVIVFTFYPTITKQLVDLFACDEIMSGRFYLKYDVGIECFTTAWSQWAFGVGLTLLLLFTVGTPLGILAYIHAQQKQVNRRDGKFGEMEQRFLNAQWCFVLEGYKSNLRYWEFYNFSRKALIVLIADTTTGPTIQLLGCMALLMVCLVLQIKLEPYEDQKHIDLNYLESLGLSCSVSTMFLGLCLLQAKTDSTRLAISVLNITMNVWTMLVFITALIHYLVPMPAKAIQQLSKGRMCVNLESLLEGMSRNTRILTKSPMHNYNRWSTDRQSRSDSRDETAATAAAATATAAAAVLESEVEDEDNGEQTPPANTNEENQTIILGSELEDAMHVMNVKLPPLTDAKSMETSPREHNSPAVQLTEL